MESTLLATTLAISPAIPPTIPPTIPPGRQPIGRPTKVRETASKVPFDQDTLEKIISWTESEIPAEVQAQRLNITQKTLYDRLRASGYLYKRRWAVMPILPVPTSLFAGIADVRGSHK